MKFRSLAVALAMVLPLACAHAASDHYSNATWTQPQAPFQIYGNVYYVGTKGLSSLLIVSPQGDVLIDGTLKENAPLIEANIRALGKRLSDVKLILNTHAHGDHAGGLAQLARDTGAQVLASPKAAKALEAGGKDPDDPQYGEGLDYPPVANVKTITDGQVIKLGDLALTAHFTPGHTPGGTSWTWQSCENGKCLNIAYVDSLTPLTFGAYRYSDKAHPERVADFRRSLATVAALPCDLLITPHPDAIDFIDNAAKRTATSNPLIDPQACKAYSANAKAKLDKKLAEEAAENSK